MPSRAARGLKSRKDGLRFCWLFGLYTLLAFLLLYALHKPLVIPFTELIAKASYVLLRLAGVQAWVSGVSVGIPGFSVEIKNNCNAIYEIGLLLAAIFAFPAPLTHRLTGALLGSGILYLINLIRILSLIAVGRYWPWSFDVAHLYVWQALFLSVVASCWLGWVSRVRQLA